jgi:hypothetical protein
LKESEIKSKEDGSKITILLENLRVFKVDLPEILFLLDKEK